MSPWSCWYTGNNEYADFLASLSLPAQCPLQWFLFLSPLPLLKPITPNNTSGNVTFILIVKFLQVFQWNWSCNSLYIVRFPAFAAVVTAFYYYHTYAGSVITLSAATVDNIYRISIISLTVLPQSLHANLSLGL